MYIWNEKAHLTYCTNIHPGESLAEVTEQMKTHLPKIRHITGIQRPMGLGLRLSDRASRDLTGNTPLSLEHETTTSPPPDTVLAFQELLDATGFYVHTMNAFPYGAFHRSSTSEPIKEKVYEPDWSTKERLEYTIRMFQLLHQLVPERVSDSSLSTSPVAYHPDRTDRTPDSAAVEHLAEVSYFLYRLHEKTGRDFHLDLEPEPDCLLEDTETTIRFFTDHLFQEGRNYLKDKHGLDESRAHSILSRHIGVCFDTAHFSTVFEDLIQSYDRIAAAGIRIGKIQVSAALELPSAAGAPGIQSLFAFVDPVYLHQSALHGPAGTIQRYHDLAPAIEAWKSMSQDDLSHGAASLRTHYHVPVFLNEYGGLRTTATETDDFLVELTRRAFAGHVQTAHLEVETYTRELLPKEMLAGEWPGADQSEKTHGTPEVLQDDIAGFIAQELQHTLGKVTVR